MEPELVVNVPVPAFTVILPDPASTLILVLCVTSVPVKLILPLVLVSALLTVKRPEADKVILPVEVVKLSTVVSAPPLLAKLIDPVPVLKLPPGKVKVPVEITLNAEFALICGEAMVKLPVLVRYKPPEPTCASMVPPADVVNIFARLVPIPLALEAGTRR